MKFLFVIGFCCAIVSCGKNPTKCDCKAELEKTMSESAITGRSMISDLNKECDEIYGGAEPYMNEPCSGKEYEEKSKINFK